MTQAQAAENKNLKANDIINGNEAYERFLRGYFPNMTNEHKDLCEKIRVHVIEFYPRSLLIDRFKYFFEIIYQLSGQNAVYSSFMIGNGLTTTLCCRQYLVEYTGLPIFEDGKITVTAKKIFISYSEKWETDKKGKRTWVWEETDIPKDKETLILVEGYDTTVKGVGKEEIKKALAGVTQKFPAAIVEWLEK